jgi:hypothetical protein
VAITREDCMDRLSRVYENVFATVYKWRKKIGTIGTVTVNVCNAGQADQRLPLSRVLLGQQRYIYWRVLRNG